MIVCAGPHQKEVDQFFSPYNRRELLLKNEEAKAPCRKRILDHILKHHATDLPMRFFGFPGVRWAFENELARNFSGRLECLAVERNWGILEYGLHWMPGRIRKQSDEHLRKEVIQGYESESARILWSRAGRVLALSRMDKSSKLHRRQWANRWKKWTAFWFDFNGPLGDEVFRCLQRADAHCDSTREVIPFAITVMIGRERRGAMASVDIASGRCELVKLIMKYRRFRHFELDESFTYRSLRVRMLTVLGRFTGTNTVGATAACRRASEKELATPDTRSPTVRNTNTAGSRLPIALGSRRG